MANTIIQIRSSGVTGNVPQSLQPGELAINYVDGKLFYGNAASQSVLFDVITEPSGLNGELQFNNLGSFGSDASLSFDSSAKTLSVTNLLVSGLNVNPTLTYSFNTANSSYLHANAAFAYANALSGGTSTDGVARSIANSAYIQANSAFENSNTALQYATSAGSYANSAYIAANTADQKAVSAGSYANSAYIHANSAYTAANNATDTWVRTAANSASSYANSAYVQANTATVLAQAAFDAANTGGGSGTISVANDTTTNAQYYITFTDATSGTLSSLNVSNTKLGYNPSTGTLKVESIDVTQNTNISSGSTEDSTGSQFIVDSFSVDEIRSAFYQVQIESSSGHQVLSLNVIHDGSTANVSTFGNTFSGTSLGSFTATIVGSALRVLFTSSVGAVVVSFIKSTIRKIAQLFPSGDLGYVGDSATAIYDLGYVGDSATSSVDYGGLN